jgi:hypothetical protein
MEIQRTAAASTYVTFPMLSNTGVPQTGLTVLGHWVAWADTASPAGQSLRPLSGAVVEIDTSALYTCPLASTELPVASPYVLLRFSTAGVATQYLLVRTATLFANASVVGAGAITSGSFAAGAINASAIAADAIGASELAADAVAEIADAVWDEVIYGAHNADNTAGKVMLRQYHATDYLNTSIVAVGSQYADDFLGRNLHRGASGGRTVGQALMALRNKVSISAGTLTVTGENDSTTEWTATIATEAVTAIVTSIDPA